MPDQSETRPAWPSWYGFAGLGLALAFTVVATGVLYALFKSAGIVHSTDAPGFNLAATLLQDGALAGAAVFLAAQTAPPQPWQFGLRSFDWRTAFKWVAIGVGIYLGFQILYVAIVHPHEQQTTLKDLGAGNGPVLTALIGIMVVGIAPFVEEFFFRGFLYGSLRTNMGFLPAAVLAGAVFGAVHITTGIQAVPPLMALGFALCLIYEATGSILPGICLHAINNMVAFGVDKDGSWAVGGSVAALVVAVCVTAPGRSRTLT